MEMDDVAMAVAVAMFDATLPVLEKGPECR